NQAISIIRKKHKQILENWMKFQLSDEGLREDLMSNEDLRIQSEELLQTFGESLSDTSIEDPRSDVFTPVIDILNGISISRAKQGFSPRETGSFVLGLKDALVAILQQEIKDPQELFVQSNKIS